MPSQTFMKGFEGDHVLITGASGAIGSVVAKKLLSETKKGTRGPRKIVILAMEEQSLNGPKNSKLY